MCSPKSLLSLACHPFGKFVLGPYYRHQLFPAKSRRETRDTVDLTNALLPSADDPKLHVVEYRAKSARRSRISGKKIFFFIHGRNCSASAAGRQGRKTSQIVDDLLDYGAVFGVNLPGYERSPLTDGRLANAERDTIEVTGHLESFVRRLAGTRGIDERDVIIVGYSIGTYMSLCLASKLQAASVVLIAPPRDLKSVRFSLLGVSLKPLIPWAASHAFPRDLELQDSPQYKTTGFNSVRFLERYGSRIVGNLAIFVAERDEIVPRDAGHELKSAFERSTVEKGPKGSARLYTMYGCPHNASPSRGNWETLWEDWGLVTGPHQLEELLWLCNTKG